LPRQRGCSSGKVSRHVVLAPCMSHHAEQTPLCTQHLTCCCWSRCCPVATWRRMSTSCGGRRGGEWVHERRGPGGGQERAPEAVTMQASKQMCRPCLRCQPHYSEQHPNIADAQSRTVVVSLRTWATGTTPSSPPAGAAARSAARPASKSTTESSRRPPRVCRREPPAWNGAGCRVLAEGALCAKEDRGTIIPGKRTRGHQAAHNPPMPGTAPSPPLPRTSAAASAAAGRSRLHAAAHGLQHLHQALGELAQVAVAAAAMAAAAAAAGAARRADAAGADGAGQRLQWLQSALLASQHCSWRVQRQGMGGQRVGEALVRRLCCPVRCPGVSR